MKAKAGLSIGRVMTTAFFIGKVSIFFMNDALLMHSITAKRWMPCNWLFGEKGIQNPSEGDFSTRQRKPAPAKP